MYTRDGAGIWSQQAYTSRRPTRIPAICSPRIVELSGDTLAVGAYHEDSIANGIDGDQSDNSANNAGAVYKFTRDMAGVWSQQSYIKASNTDAGDSFGRSVTLSGDTMAVGALFEESAATGIDGDQSDNSAGGGGAVYVYTGDGAGVWSQQSYIKASNTDAEDGFGGAVALSGDTLAVSGNHENSAASGIDGDQGDNSAEIALAPSMCSRAMGPGSGRSKPISKRPIPDSGDFFGKSVTLSGDTLAVGAQFGTRPAPQSESMVMRTTTVPDHSGTVYVYTRDGGGSLVAASLYQSV